VGDVYAVRLVGDVSDMTIPTRAAGMRLVVVGRVPASATRPLRQALLRPHQRLDEVQVPGEDHPSAAWFGAIEEGEVVGTAGVMPEDRDGLERPAWRVRAMATVSSIRGLGIGRMLLDGCVEHAVEHGAVAIWCSARVPAAGFYRGAGFTPLGEVHDLPPIGPHIDMSLVP
jgi:GNAT superfamily N-acetyltransferase